MECTVGQRVMPTTHSFFPQREEVFTSRHRNAAVPGGSVWRNGRGGSSPAPSLKIRRISAEKIKNVKKTRGLKSSVVVAAKLGGAVDVLSENEPLMELNRGQHQFFHRLPSGLRMEVICQKGAAPDGGGGGGQGSSSRAPLLFVHGSYHAAWCWQCWWLPYFAARGHDCYAISLLGQGASDVPVEKVSFSLQSHARDMAHFIRHNLTAPPVLVGHSFGGLIVQWFFSHIESTANLPPNTLKDGSGEAFPNIAAAALVCSTPPTGNGPMVKRFMKRDIIASIKITLSLAAKLFGSSLSLCRKSFFSPDIPDTEVQKYQKLLKYSSRYPMLDLQKLNDSLPLPKRPHQAPPVFVLAAENDFIVDPEGSQETAEWYGTEPLVISGSGHDIMLDIAWEKAAEALQSWVDQQAL